MSNTPEGAARTPLVGIIINPKHASTRRAYPNLIEGVREQGLHYRTMTTSTQRPGAWQAAQLVEWGAEAVIILGGDGTIRAAAPTLAETRTLTFLIPTGTANVLCRHLGVASATAAIDHCVRALRGSGGTGPTDEVTNVPVNLAETRDAGGVWTRHHFLSLAGIGGDALAVAHHHSAPGLFGYAWGAARALFAPDHTPAGGTAPTIDFPVWSLMASKAARPAGPITVFPKARIDGAEFSVLTVGPLPHRTGRRLTTWAGIAAACIAGRPETHPLMHYRSAHSAAIRLTTPAPVQVDGDVLGEFCELRVSTGERCLRVSAPAA